MPNFKLKSVGIEVTWNCNQHCSYCYLSCSNENNSSKKEMFPGLFEKTLDRVWTAGVKDIYLIGGEPTLHANFENLLLLMNKYAWVRKGICTNGVNLDKKKIDIISKNFNYASVSLRGTHNTTGIITQNKSGFSKTINTLRKFSSSGIEIRIEVDLLPQYFGEFNKIIKILEKNKINFKYIDLHRIIPIGAAQIKDTAPIVAYQHLLEEIHAIVVKKKYVIAFEDCLPLCLFNKKYWPYINICRCGTSKVWVDPSGYVRRCACSSGSIGNVKKQDFNTIWSSKIMKDFHSFTWVSDECKECQVFKKCLGGCSSSRGVKFFDQDIFSNNFKAIKQTI